jgi:O-antigen ligase
LLVQPLLRYSHAPLSVAVLRRKWLAAGCAVVCLLSLDGLLLEWLQIGPPAGKGPIFFVEVVLLLAGSVLCLATAALKPGAAREITPYIFAIFCWHTGFEINLEPTGSAVLSATDLLLPIMFLGGLGAGWWTQAGRPAINHAVWKLYAVLLVFCVWGLGIAFVRSVYPLAVYTNLIAFVVYPLLLFVMLWSITTWNHLFRVIGLTLALILERALESATGHGHVTQSFVSATQLASRATGDFASANQYAFYLMTGTLMSVTLLLSLRDTKLRLAILVVSTPITYELVRSLSRGAYLGTAVALLFLACFLRRRQGLALVIGLLLAFAGVQALSPSTSSLVDSRIHVVDRSAQSRLAYTQLALHVIKQYPVGAGWGAAFYLAPDSSLRPILNHKHAFPWYHNDYLQLATQIGIAGLGVFLLLWFWIMRRGVAAFRGTASAPRGVILAILTALVGCLVQAATDQFFWRADIAPYIWMLAGLLLAAVQLERPLSRSSGIEAERHQQHGRVPSWRV